MKLLSLEQIKEPPLHRWQAHKRDLSESLPRGTLRFCASTQASADTSSTGFATQVVRIRISG